MSCAVGVPDAQAGEEVHPELVAEERLAPANRYVRAVQDVDGAQFRRQAQLNGRVFRQLVLHPAEKRAERSGKG